MSRHNGDLRFVVVYISLHKDLHSIYISLATQYTSTMSPANAAASASGSENLSFEDQPIAWQDRENRQHGELTTVLEVSAHPHCRSVRRLELTIFLKMEGQEKFELGYLIAWHVDKSVSTTRGRPQWISDMFGHRQEDGESELNELKTAIRALFWKTGQPFWDLEVRDKLFVDDIVFIDTFQIEHKNYRGKGLAQLVIRSFHHLLPQCVAPEESGSEETETEASNIVVILCPAACSEEPPVPPKTAVDVERSLVKSYKKTGYAVWIEGPEIEDDTITIMGRTL